MDSFYGFERSPLPLDLILEIREAMKRGDFDKRIVKRTPYSVDVDAAELECGHTRPVAVEYEKGKDEPEHLYCRECRALWISSL